MSLFRRAIAWFGHTTRLADPECSECYGDGFDAGGQRCDCVIVQRRPLR